MERKRRKMSGRVVVLALIVMPALAACSGCAGLEPYLANRGADFLDIFMVEMTAGPGVDVHAQFTSYLGTAVGGSLQEGLLWHGRHFGMGKRDTMGLLVMAVTESEGRQMFSLHGGTHEARGGAWYALLPFKRGPAGGELSMDAAEKWPHNLDIQIGASIIYGLHVGISPGEFIDFLVGLTTVDLANDDLEGEEPAAVKKEKEPIDPSMNIP